MPPNRVRFADPLPENDEGRMGDLGSEIETVAATPKGTSFGGDAVTEHSLPELIAADRHLNEKTAAGRTPQRRLSKLFVKAVPPGAG